MIHKELIDNYIKFLSTFSELKKQEFDFEKMEISTAIFAHIYRLRRAQWKHNIDFKRMKRSTIADIFQDIIALYLKLALDDDYEIIVESCKKDTKLQPDILIKYNDKNIFILEIKTNLGWVRNLAKDENIINKRNEALAKDYAVPQKNIVYILQSPANVNKDFTSRYLDLSSKPYKTKDLPEDDFYSRIRPLMHGDDPFYHFKTFWEAEKITDEEILEMAKERIIIPLEKTIKDIKIAAANRMKPTLLYIHGLGSDQNSRKFLALKEYFKDQFHYDFIEWNNDSNIYQLLDASNERLKNVEKLIVVGDSTGANFSYQLREMRKKYSGKTTLILTSPLLNLDNRIADFDFPQNIIQFLWKIEKPENVLIIASPNDKILNQKYLAEDIENGLEFLETEDTHRLENFENYLPKIENYINSKK